MHRDKQASVCSLEDGKKSAAPEMLWVVVGFLLPSTQIPWGQVFYTRSGGN